MYLCVCVCVYVRMSVFVCVCVCVCVTDRETFGQKKAVVECCGASRSLDSLAVLWHLSVWSKAESRHVCTHLCVCRSLSLPLPSPSLSVSLTLSLSFTLSHTLSLSLSLPSPSLSLCCSFCTMSDASGPFLYRC